MAAAMVTNHNVSDKLSSSRDVEKSISSDIVNGLAFDQQNERRMQHASPSSSVLPKKERNDHVLEDDDDDLPLLVRKQKAGKQQENGHVSDNTRTSPTKIKIELKSPDNTPRVKTEKTPSPKKDISLHIKLNKTTTQSDDEDEMPLANRAKKLKASQNEHSQVKQTTEKKSDHKSKKRKSGGDDDEDFTPSKKSKHESKPSKNHDSKEKKHDKKVKEEASKSHSPTKKRGKKEEDEPEVWKWWEEASLGEGVKWKFLEHKGPVFAPSYEPLPSDVKFTYDGKHVKLSSEAEEVATFYARMLDHDYTTKELFNKNFFKDWRKVMTSKERELIVDLKKCGFQAMSEYFKKLSEERKNTTKEDKLKAKVEKDEVQKVYGVAVIDGHKEKIGNFRVEPPGLFRGRGTHPKMGMLKRRVMPEDVIINCSRDSKIPQPPAGHKWKEVRHDNTVTWLASWTENINGNIKYVMLNPSSKIKGEKDWMKYETARKLKQFVGRIREQYRADWKSKEMRLRQRAVALYFIDKLALRAGNEKEEGETADTVGCCSLRCEHIKLYDELDGQECVVEFDFLGKDSIRYYNRVPVEKRVFKNLKLFMENKDPGDDLFDRLTTTIVNKYLQSLMDGLTAKVFRTYNASSTLQDQLNMLTKPEMSVAEKLLAYNRANRQVAILCNHQRAVPKTHDKQMENLQSKIKEKEDQLKAAKKEYKSAKADYKGSKNEKNKKLLEQKQRQLDRTDEQLKKLQLRATDKEENKEIALGTSKLNYLDPRISVGWCKKYGIPIEKIYNKTQREKFRWAIDMAGPEFVF